MWAEPGRSRDGGASFVDTLGTEVRSGSDNTLALVRLNVLIAPWPIHYCVRLPECFLRTVRVARLSFNAREHLFDSRRTAMIGVETASDV